MDFSFYDVLKFIFFNMARTEPNEEQNFVSRRAEQNCLKHRNARAELSRSGSSGLIRAWLEPERLDPLWLKLHHGGSSMGGPTPQPSRLND